MAVVVELSREGHQSLDDYVAVIQGRIQSMARTQERLSSNRWAGIGVEALIAGWGMAEALRRAEAHRAAGADADLASEAGQIAPVAQPADGVSHAPKITTATADATTMNLGRGFMREKDTL